METKREEVSEAINSDVANSEAVAQTDNLPKDSTAINPSLEATCDETQDQLESDDNEFKLPYQYRSALDMVSSKLKNVADEQVNDLSED